MNPKFFKVVLCALSLLILHMPLCVLAQEAKPKKAVARSVYSGVPSGYSQLGSTDLFYHQTSESIDFIGRFSSQYYSSTYSNGGYRLALQVGDNSAVSVNCLSGTTIDSVSCFVSVVQQGELGRVIYTVTNSKTEDVIVSLGTHADVMIGSNDRAPISRKIDTIGNTYGLTMKDGNGAQLCVLFGAGLVGVNSVSNFWFGYYRLNSNVSNMVGNYSSGSNYMEENGSYDSGMGWCWKERTIPANSSVEFSYLIGVGDVNLEPTSSFEVTPEDPDGWNDLSRPHRLTLEGEYESPAGQNGKIQYAIEDSEEWLDLTDEIESGSTFTASLVAMFDANKENHTIRFRTMDAVGNTSMLTPIIYKDVSYHPVTGIEDKVYNWGDSIYQTNLSCDLPIDQFAIDNYRNNSNAGIASFNIEGVFPYSIGRKTYTFTINPLPLAGQILLEQNQYVYDGTYHCPSWTFSDESFNSLELDKDYTISWLNNVAPGTAQLRISGKGNFTNELISNFNIDKAQLRTDLYRVTLPNDDVTFDGNSHGASVSVSQGVGMPTIYYSSLGQTELTEIAPKDNGSYDIYLEFADGEFYYGKELEKIFTFTIYQFDETDWLTIQQVAPILEEHGWSKNWDLSGGITNASRLPGLIIEQGKVIGLDLSNSSLEGNIPPELLTFPNLRSLNLSGNNLTGTHEIISDFIQNQPGLGTQLTELNISNNSLSGNLGLLATCFPNLMKIDATRNHFSDINPMISEKVVSLYIGSQEIDRTVEYDLSNMSLDDLYSHIPTILTYDHQARNYSRPFTLDCTAEDGFVLSLHFNNGLSRITFPGNQKVYFGESGDFFDVTDFYYNNHFKLKLTFEPGDVNFINGLDITDLQATILYVFEDFDALEGFNFTAADTYTDSVINVQDVVFTVNLLLNRPTVNLTHPLAAWNSSFTTNINDNQIWIENGRIIIKNDTPIAALAIDMDSSAEFDLTKFGMSSVSNGTRTIAYSMSGGQIPEGINEIGTCQSDAKILNITMSTDKAQPIDIDIKNNVSSSIDEIISDDNTYEIYTPEGIRIPSLRKGVNIIKYPDNKISKIYIR